MKGALYARVIPEEQRVSSNTQTKSMERHERAYDFDEMLSEIQGGLENLAESHVPWENGAHGRHIGTGQVLYGYFVVET